MWLLRCQTSGPAPRASIPESGPRVSRHSASLANTFLGQRSPAHGEGGCGSVSDGAGCRAGVSWLEGTWHLPWAPSEEWRAGPWLAKCPSGEQS